MERVIPEHNPILTRDTRAVGCSRTALTRKTELRKVGGAGNPHSHVAWLFREYKIAPYRTDERAVLSQLLHSELDAWK